MFSINIRGTVYTARTLAGISAAYCKARDESGEGATTWPTTSVYQDIEHIAGLSYNGRVWPLSSWGISWQPDRMPLYDPAADPVPDMLAALKFAAERVALANAEGNPILSAWLPDARAAIAKAESALT